MASQQGICINFGGCSKADKHEIVNIPQGADLVCPECGSRLKVRQASSAIPRGLIVVGLVFVAMVIVGAWLVMHHKPVHVAHAPSPAATPTPAATVSRNVLLRFNGSNTIGAKLAPELVKSFLQQLGDTDVRIIRGANDEESTIEGRHGNAQDVVEIKAHGSANAFASLQAGQSDIGMASRRITPAEVQQLQPLLGDLTSNTSEHVLALDGVAVIVNQANVVRGLTMDQLARIFAGEITDWSQVGGAGDPISLYARDEKSGTFDFFNDSVLKPHGKRLAALPAERRFDDSTKLSDAVAADPGGIGFIGLPYVGANKALAIGDTGVTPRKPSVMTVKTEDYLLSRRLYLYTPATAKNPNASKFIEFALAKTAQPIVTEVGFMGMDVSPLAASDPKTVGTDDPRAASAQWRQLTSGAIELPTRLRFRSGSSQLDTRANRDIGRIDGLLSQPSYSGAKVILIGFADSSGMPAANKKLSEDRARIAGRELSPYGVNIATAAGLGAEAFVASNETPEGREKNRRVEVWLRK